MTRILQVNKFYYPYIGGVEKVVQQISEELLREPEVRNEVLACKPSRGDQVRVIRGVSTTLAGSVRTVLGMPISPSFPRLLGRCALDKDIVDFHMPFPLAAWSLGRLSKNRAKIVVHYHADVVRQRKLKWAYEPAFRRLLDKASAIAVSSPNLRDNSLLLRDYRDKCHVIPFMVSLPGVGTSTDSDRHEVRRRLGIPPSLPIVLYVGRFVYYKGLHFLLEAMKGVEAALLLVGDGPLRPLLKAQAEETGISDRVFWASDVPDEQLAAYYGVGDVFVLPSCANTEAYGIVQMEALASGLPVINTSLPTGVPWVSRHGESGLTVQPGSSGALNEAIRAILDDSRLRERLSVGALHRADDFKPERVRKATMRLYLSVLS